MEYSRLNLLVTTISCLAVLIFPIFVTGCGDSGNDDDSMSSEVVYTRSRACVRADATTGTTTSTGATTSTATGTTA